MNFHQLGERLAGAWRDPEFWEKAWQTAWEQSLHHLQRRGRAGGEYWDRRAARFAAHACSDNADDRVMKIVHLLGHKDILKKESQVLDIGSGPGNCAIPIARRVRRVVALDPSGGMLELLQQRAAEAGLSNVETVQQAWEEIDLDQAGWRGAFDVVLALNTPPFNGVANLKKMLAACRGVFLGGDHLWQDDPGWHELWRELGLGEMPHWCPGPFYAYHWLYASGYYPDLDMEHYYSLRQLAPEEAQKELEDSLYPYLDLTPAVSERIRAFVEQRASNGIFLSAHASVIGWVVCTVGAPVPEDEQIHTHSHDHDHAHSHDHDHAHADHTHTHTHNHDHAHDHHHDHGYSNAHGHAHDHGHDHHHAQ
jgi:SAM-dependent methyltransferase